MCNEHLWAKLNLQGNNDYLQSFKNNTSANHSDYHFV